LKVLIKRNIIDINFGNDIPIYTIYFQLNLYVIFSLMIYLQNFVDIVKVQTDMSGKVLFYHSEINQLIFKIKQ
jgi:hypothetical protein